MKIHVTSASGCRRELMHRLHGDDQLPHHFLAVKGILTHKVIENSLRDIEEYEIQYPGLIEDRDIEGGRNDSDRILEEVYTEALPAVAKGLDSYKVWVNETPIDLDRLITEETQHVQYNGHEIIGTPDAYSHECLIDFKSGKTVQSAYKKQLAAYDWMLRQNGKIDGQIKHKIVLLGQDPTIPFEKRERTITKNDIEKGLAEWFDDVDDYIAETMHILDDPEYKPACKFGVKCGFCSYRHLCNGI